uniref:Uncharacterized protein n=1 Tax=Hyaloperonospora arabidopsidis (strain Emoy2) TaxID=559515 RepID=M4BAG3_HYAAE
MSAIKGGTCHPIGDSVDVTLPRERPSHPIPVYAQKQRYEGEERRIAQVDDAAALAQAQQALHVGAVPSTASRRIHRRARGSRSPVPALLSVVPPAVSRDRPPIIRRRSKASHGHRSGARSRWRQRSGWRRSRRNGYRTWGRGDGRWRQFEAVRDHVKCAARAATAAAAGCGLLFWVFGICTHCWTHVSDDLRWCRVLGVWQLFGWCQVFTTSVQADMKPSLDPDVEASHDKAVRRPHGEVFKNVLMGLTMSGINPALLASYTGAIASDWQLVDV